MGALSFPGTVGVPKGYWVSQGVWESHCRWYWVSQRAWGPWGAVRVPRMYWASRGVFLKSIGDPWELQVALTVAEVLGAEEVHGAIKVDGRGPGPAQGHACPALHIDSLSPAAEQEPSMQLGQQGSSGLAALGIRHSGWGGGRQGYTGKQPLPRCWRHQELAGRQPGLVHARPAVQQYQPQCLGGCERRGQYQSRQQAWEGRYEDGGADRGWGAVLTQWLEPQGHGG